MNDLIFNRFFYFYLFSIVSYIMSINIIFFLFNFYFFKNIRLETLRCFLYLFIQNHEF